MQRSHLFLRPLVPATLGCLFLLCRVVVPARAANITVGTAPAGLALNPATGMLYVANAGDGTVSIIATTSQSVTSVIPLDTTLSLGGSAAPEGVGVDLGSNLVFVAESGAKRIGLIDGTTNQLRSTIPADVGPWGVAVNQTTQTVYVSGLAGTLTVLDGTSGTVKSVLRDSRFARPLGVAVDEVRNRVYVANVDSNSVAVLDGSSNTIVGTVPVGSKPAAVAVDAGSGAVYVANSGTSTLSVLDPGTLTISSTLSTGQGPVALAMDPTVGVLYAASRDNSVSVFTGEALLGTLTDANLSEPQAVAIAPGGTSLYLSSGGGNGVTVLPAVGPPPASPAAT